MENFAGRIEAGASSPSGKQSDSFDEVLAITHLSTLFHVHFGKSNSSSLMLTQIVCWLMNTDVYTFEHSVATLTLWVGRMILDIFVLFGEQLSDIYPDVPFPIPNIRNSSIFAATVPES